MRLDLSEPRFTQAQACEITGLSRASIQTRLNRGQVKLAQHNPGRQAKRLLSPLDLIKLSFIEQMSRHHFSSGVAAEIADDIAGHALRWWKKHPEETKPTLDVETGQVRDDAPAIHLKAWKEGWDDLWHLVIFTNSDGVVEGHVYKLSDEDHWKNEDLLYPDIYTVIQIDVLLSRIINKILRFIHEENKK